MHVVLGRVHFGVYVVRVRVRIEEVMMAKKQWLETLGMAMIGEGVVGTIHPEKHMGLWRIGPKPLRAVVTSMADHPSLMRIGFVAEAVLGYWLVRRQIDR